jgi:hypothetical protein
VLQQKGWRYHFYPSLATGFLLLTVLIRSAVRPASTAGRIYLAAAIAVLLYLPLTTAADAVGRMVDPEDPRYLPDRDLPVLRDIVRKEAPSGSILVLSMKISSAFPLVPVSGASWAMRFPSLWMLAAIYREQLASHTPLQFEPASERSSLERDLVEAVSSDLRRVRPDLLIVLRPSPDRWEWGARRLDYLRYFASDSVFANELEAYSFLRDVGEYRIFKRSHDGAGRPAPIEGSPPDILPEARALRPGLYLAEMGWRELLRAILFSACLTVGLAWAWRGRPVRMES